MKVKDIIASLKRLGPDVEVSNIKGKFTYPDYDSDSDPDDSDDESDNNRKMTGVEVTLSLQPPEPEETDDEDDEPFFDKLKEAAGRGRRNR